MENQEEIWKDIPTFEGQYSVSNKGNVKSLKREVLRNNGWLLPLEERLLKLTKNKAGYFVAGLSNGSKTKVIRVHQLVAMAFLGHVRCGYIKVVDHIDGNRANNNLSNLRLVTQRENSSNIRPNSTSKYTGVCWSKAKRKWEARITFNGKQKFLGYFKTEIEASECYKNKVLQLTEAQQVLENLTARLK